MNRRNFLQVTVPAGIGLSSGIKLSGEPSPLQRWEIANSRMRLEFSEESNGGLAAFIDIKSQRNFIAKTFPLYRIFLAQKGKKVVELTSRDASAVRVDRASAGDGETLTLTYGRHGAHDVTVVCSVRLEADSPLSRWHIKVNNNTPYGVRALHYPVVVSPVSDFGAPTADYFVNPAWGGYRMKVNEKRDDGKHEPTADRADGMGTAYPNTGSLQMHAYYNATAGLFMATYDAGINAKHFGSARLHDGLDISIEHNYDERPGIDFELPYDTVAGVFHDDWYEAADHYKQWAIGQPWCARKISERTELPQWLTEPRPVLQYECRADYHRCQGWVTNPGADFPNGRFFPAKNVIPLTEKYISLFASPAVVWYNGWEKWGNPSGPVDSFPPLEGEESLKAAMDEIAHGGSIPFMAVWGNHWIYKRSLAGYDGWERFKKEGADLAALDNKGEIPKRGGAEFTFVPLCQGSERMQQMFVEYFGKVIDLGAVALEFDLQAWPSDCYSDRHGHAPGFGAWMGQRTTEFLQKIRTLVKQRNPHGSLSTEGTAEAWIQHIDFMLDRPYFSGAIPLFTYIYHEYIPLLGGDGRVGVSTPDEQLIQQAANFSFGHSKFVMVGLNDYNFAVNPNYPIFTLVRNLCAADRGFAREYQVLGKMLRPTPLDCRKVTVDAGVPRIKPLEDLPDPPRVDVPRVMHNVWESPAKKLGYVLVNWSGEDERVKLTLVHRQGSAAIITASGKTSVPAGEVSAGIVTATVPARSVILVEQT